MTLQGKWITCSKIKEAHSLGQLLNFFIPTKLKIFELCFINFDLSCEN